MKCVVFFHNFGFWIKSFHTLHWRFHLLFWEIKEAARFPSGFDRRKVAKRKFLCSNVQSLKRLSTRVIWLLMFFEIVKISITWAWEYVQRFLNTRVSISLTLTLTSNHACLDLFFEGYQGPSMHVAQIRPHDWLIRLALLMSLRNLERNWKFPVGCSCPPDLTLSSGWQWSQNELFYVCFVWLLIHWEILAMPTLQGGAQGAK